MDKRKLSKIPRPEATQDMFEIVGRLGDMRDIVTADLINDDEKILQLTFYRTDQLRKGKPEAAFRTFVSENDYITQDLKTSKVKWLTASFSMMENFSLFDSHWNKKIHEFEHNMLAYIRSDQELELMKSFFKDYARNGDVFGPWSAIYRFQEEVKEKRLAVKHKKETDKIDAVMAPIREAPKEFFNWVWDKGMSFSRYLIYQDVGNGEAECECTHCNGRGKVLREKIRLRNNEYGKCPFCGSKVTIKARGKMPAQIRDERWFLYVDPTENGFLLRYFLAVRKVRSDNYIANLLDNSRIDQWIYEYSRAFYDFSRTPDKPEITSYEWGVYKQRGASRWCPDMGKIACMECILYPENLPQAWAHTPMKYSALEVMSASIPTTAFRYEDAMKAYRKFPKLEWFCKMGLTNLAMQIASGHNGVSRINKGADTIFRILGLTKENTRTLQAINGTDYHLRLLQAAQKSGIRLTGEQLIEYYNTFECNVELLTSARKVSLHKLCKYIAKESERYPLGEKNGGCWRYSYMRYKERTDPRIERQRNMAKDWLEYLGWCKELGHDTDNMFWYMPTNFKKVHDRTAKEYQEMKDRKAAALRKRKETLVKKALEKTEKEMEVIFDKNGDTGNFTVRGNGLVLVVPKTMQEIRDEGSTLHHCVGTYVDRVMRGETNIFFVRKADDPTTPYFTMEYKNSKVVQCRGLNNCSMPTAVKAFVTVFEKRMNEVLNQEVTREERRCS